jgi:hypothetical protein
MALPERADAGCVKSYICNPDGANCRLQTVNCKGYIDPGPKDYPHYRPYAAKAMKKKSGTLTTEKPYYRPPEKMTK